jgi:cytochrome c556
MRLLILCSGIILAACPAALAQPTAAARDPAGLPTVRQLVAARQAGMHMSATLLYRGLKVAVQNGTDPREQVHEAEGLQLWGDAIPGLFPPGSAYPQSRALPSIWTNKADFDAKAAALRDEAGKLAALAGAGDKAAFAAQVAVVETACQACHKAYRGA